MIFVLQPKIRLLREGIMTSKEFHEISYELHKDNYEKIYSDEKERKKSECWIREDTTAAWVHFRRCKLIDSLLNYYPEAYWLTIGDGRYGNDAHYVESKGVKALATDISCVFLAEAKQRGHIKDYQQENAEALSFEDNSFDFVYCKESLHHFPRPMLALYEMIRVARKAVVLFEPNDAITSSIRIHLVQKLRALIRKIKGTQPAYFEKAGNYVYGISQRELEKVCMALSFSVLAIKGVNDFHIEGMEWEIFDNNSKLFKKLKFKIFLRDLLCKLELRPYLYLSTIIFKEPPDTNLRDALYRYGYNLINLPVSPKSATYKTLNSK